MHPKHLVRNEEDGKGGSSGGTMNTGQTPVGDKVDEVKKAETAANTDPPGANTTNIA